MYFFCEEKVHTFECVAKEYARSGTYFDDVMQRERERGCLVTHTMTVNKTFYISFILMSNIIVFTIAIFFSLIVLPKILTMCPIPN